MFYDQLIQLCERDGIKPTSLLLSLGMSKGSLSNWKDGKLPTGDALVRFSEHFNVSIDYLVYGNDTLEELNQEDIEWLNLIHSLPRDAQLEFKGEMKGYLRRMRQEDPSEDELKQAK